MVTLAGICEFSVVNRRTPWHLCRCFLCRPLHNCHSVVTVKLFLDCEPTFMKPCYLTSISAAWKTDSSGGKLAFSWLVLLSFAGRWFILQSNRKWAQFGMREVQLETMQASVMCHYSRKRQNKYVEINVLDRVCLWISSSSYTSTTALFCGNVQ